MAQESLGPGIEPWCGVAVGDPGTVMSRYTNSCSAKLLEYLQMT